MMTEKSRALAEAAAAERLINAYLRETQVFDPTGKAQGELLSEIETELSRQGQVMKVELPSLTRSVWGAVMYLSPFGHHRYGEAFYLKHEQQGHAERLQNSEDLAALLFAELAAREPADSQAGKRVLEMTAAVQNSISKTERYVRHSLNGTKSLWSLPGKERMAASEQRLVYGHPFHPTPKSSAGFSEEDLARYAPELGAAFKLRYFAAAPELVQEAFVEAGDEELFPKDVLAEAKRLLTEEQQTYKLFPVHPWQAAHLLEWPEVQALTAEQKLVDLGELGNRVFPTSSVRTVWDPEHRYYFKLPLNVRITNFVRVNPPEQLERTLDAARVLAEIGPTVPYEGFTILREAGYRTLRIPGEAQERLAESFGVIFRENPAVSAAGDATPLVVASLLEQSPSEAEPPLLQAVRIAADRAGKTMSAQWLKKWLTRYLEISLVPLTWLFVRHGASLEAHVQNSMVALEHGWPVGFYVRDLEGVSLSQERADERVPAGSPVLYPDREAWSRLKYYVFVNHFGHLISTLACDGGGDERQLWQTVRDVLRESGVFAGGGEAYLEDLQTAAGWPAKANMISSFQKRGEKPSYAAIPNPLLKSEVSI